MSSKAKAFFSSLIAGVIFLAMFFFIVPWLLLILAVVGIAVFASLLLGRGSINITTIRITNSPKVEQKAGMSREILGQDPDTDITIYPDGSIPEAVPEEDSFEAVKKIH